MKYFILDTNILFQLYATPILDDIGMNKIVLLKSVEEQFSLHFTKYCDSKNLEKNINKAIINEKNILYFKPANIPLRKLVQYNQYREDEHILNTIILYSAKNFQEVTNKENSEFYFVTDDKVLFQEKNKISELNTISFNSFKEYCEVNKANKA